MKKSIKSSPAAEKTPSGKKLIQARLPFKILSSPDSVTTPAKQLQRQGSSVEKDTRKRKLSTEADLPASKILCPSEIKENLSKDDAIIVSDDESVQEDPEENVVVCCDDENPAEKEGGTSPQTPKSSNNSDNLNSSVTRGKSSPFTIKLPISSKKRRNLSQKLEYSSKKNEQPSSKDDNPGKRFKVYSEEAQDGKYVTESEVIADARDNEATLGDDLCLQVTMSQDSAIHSKKKEETPLQQPDKKARSELFSYFKISEGLEVSNSKTKSNADVEEKIKDVKSTANKGSNRKNDDKRKGMVIEQSTCKINEANKEVRDIGTSNQEEKIHEEHVLEYDSKDDSDSDDDKNSHTPGKKLESNPKLRNKVCTPKQLQKQREREEKLKLKEEEKLQKQKEKEEKERLRKKEKEEKEELRRKEKEEKEELRRREKEEKEKRRLAELEAKNEERRQKEEEKRKKEELKEEERKKKEEERKRKEQEKEEEENKKRKAAEAFTKFFVQKQQKTLVKDPEEDQSSVDSDKFRNPTFMPFQVKGHMKLAPLFRRMLDVTSKTKFDELLNEQLTPKEELYLPCLKSGKICPRKESKTWLPDDDSISDCLLIEDELDEGGQSIVEINKPVQKYRAKFLYFHENQRPPYYGTWRKRSTCVKSRRPFTLDTRFFDYEVDSDDEWEEEEPGESLHGSDDEKESEDDYEVDNEFFVPHGHLSDEEIQNDEFGDENTPEMQKAKLKILQQQFAQEMKKKTEKIKPRLVGPLWQDENGNQPEQCPDKIWQSLNKRAMILTEPLLLVEPEKVEIENVSPSQEKKTTKKAQLGETEIKDLIRLVHGNRHKKQFMIKEFQAYIAKQVSTLGTPPIEYQKSTIREQIEKIAEWKVIEDKVKKKKRLCWLVLPDVLKQYNMVELTDNNKWEYILKPKSYLSSTTSTESSQKADKPVSANSSKGENESSASQIKKKKKKNLSVITKFTTTISKEIKNVLEEKGAEVVGMSKMKTSITEKKSNLCDENEKCEKDRPSDLLVPKSAEVKPSVVVKKRVPLLMSVPRGQTIPESTKNALIIDFLKKKSDTKNEDPLPFVVGNSQTVQPMEIDTIVIE